MKITKLLLACISLAFYMHGYSMELQTPAIQRTQQEIQTEFDHIMSKIVGPLKRCANDYQIFKDLIDEGADPNRVYTIPVGLACWKGKCTPFIYTCHFNKELALHILRSPKMDSNFHTTEVNTPLVEACLSIKKDSKKEDYQLVKMLLKKDNVDPNNVYENHVGEPLKIAVQEGNDTLVRLLLKYHAHPNVRDRDGRTPLFYVPADHVDIVHTLIQNGARVTVTDYEGLSTLHWHCKSTHVLPRNTEFNKFISLLIVAGIDIDEQDRDGNTALHHLVLNETGGECVLHAIRVLLGHGADTSIKNEHEQTAYEYTGSKKIRKLLQQCYRY